MSSALIRNLTLEQLAASFVLQHGEDDPVSKRLTDARQRGNLRVVRALLLSHLRTEERRHEAALDATRVQLRAVEALEVRL